MSTSNTPLTAEQATIARLEKENARLSQRLKFMTSLRDAGLDRADRFERWLQERNEEVDQLKQRIAELEK